MKTVVRVVRNAEYFGVKFVIVKDEREMNELKGLKQYKKYYVEKYDEKIRPCVQRLLSERRRAR